MTRNFSKNFFHQTHIIYTEATLKFLKLNPQAQQREAVVQGRSLSPYRLRYKRSDTNLKYKICLIINCNQISPKVYYRRNGLDIKPQ
ncbi:MAG: hypothetical protein LBJ00_00190 [Planctomycetaceae bacterium]|nr:hypothetical protein [Planctomycetaceae bacterium]